MNLLEQIADFSNLSEAFRECARGKRSSLGYQKFLFGTGERLVNIRKLLLNGSYKWHGYREFFVTDPKTRKIMAAPFIDRVVHHAINRVIEPIFDPLIPEHVFACRHGKGTRNAALYLLDALRKLGPERFSLKLDVKKYFASIDHSILMEKVLTHLPDSSIEGLLWSLIQSSEEYRILGRGIPIGNLTSQLFANFYLVPADEIAIGHIKNGYYVRYMDDLCLTGESKKEILDAGAMVIKHVEDKLKLEMPHYKRVPLGSDPVPFLGYVLDHKGFKVLRRNQRRFERKVRKLEKGVARPSHIEKIKISFSAWSSLEDKNKSCLTKELGFWSQSLSFSKGRCRPSWGQLEQWS